MSGCKDIVFTIALLMALLCIRITCMDRMDLHDAVSNRDEQRVNEILDQIRPMPAQQRLEYLSIIKDGCTALHKAAMCSSSKIVQTLLDALPEPQKLAYLTMREQRLNETALHLASSRCNHKIVEVLLAALPKEQIPAYLHLTDTMGWTALHSAASVICRFAMKAILNALPQEQRASYIKIQDEAGSTALHFTFQYHNSDRITKKADTVVTVLNTLPENLRADYANLRDGTGHTFLHLAAFLGQIDIVKILLAAGARQNIVNDAGQSPLDIARAENHTALANFLSRRTQVATTLAMAMHQRLGHESPMAELPQFLLHIISHLAE